MSRLAELGDDSVSKKGVRGLEFKAVLAELFLRLSELSRGGPAVHDWYHSLSIGRDSACQAGQELKDMWEVAESPGCTRRVRSKWDR